MKHRFKRFLSLALAAALISSVSIPALASEALGEPLAAREVELHEDTVLAENVFWSQAYTDLRTEQYITYSPNGDVTPLVTFGDTLTERSTLTALARKLEEQGLINPIQGAPEREGAKGDTLFSFAEVDAALREKRVAYVEIQKAL